MNVVLTESQVREIMKRTCWENDKRMLEEGSLDSIKSWIKRAILAGATIFSLYTAIDNIQNLTELQKKTVKHIITRRKNFTT